MSLIAIVRCSPTCSRPGKLLAELSCKNLKQNIFVNANQQTLCKNSLENRIAINPDLGPHSKENLKHVFLKSQLRNLASKYQIHNPKAKFDNSMWSVLPMRPKARVLALISVIHKLLCAVYHQLELPNALSWPTPSRSGSMRCPFQRPSLKKSNLLGHYPPAEMVKIPIKVNFLPHLSVPPLLQYRCTVHRHLCGTQNT